ncbi:hypothetical protein CCS41_12575 [Candidatus Fukatsuia symbiotica]|uniref:Endonuclease/exonuclease/phosphatase domain-containing protein n=2 Tax=Yersiniaceae TaxID=1903411 RepID=A0A2U8I7G8_9GAMM|nr:hypothetical protein CCS41_12575 [Candidatus Fukatsuia symbiotica]
MSISILHKWSSVLLWTSQRGHWFIQELSSNGTMGREIDHGFWAHYYDSQFHFYIRDNHFFYGQAEEGNNWFIQKLSSNGTMGREIDHGFWAHYYDSQFPFYINGRQFFYGQAKEGKNWFIQEISSCIDDDILSPYHFSDYKIASWNMQGANHDEGKWRNIIANEVKVISNHSNVDIFALQECGALPKSVSTVSDRAPQELISSNNNIELTQNLWALGTNYRPNDVYVYHVENGNQYNRTSMAIVSRYKADEVFIVGPVDNATRPVIGIRRGNDYFFNIHAGAHRNNESPSVISVIENYMSRIVNDNVNATWVIMGDYNTAPDDLRLTNAPLNIERGFAIPASPTHFGGGDRILDYAITGTGIENQATLTTTVSERTLSDHIIVLFIHLFLRPTGRCRRG